VVVEGVLGKEVVEVRGWVGAGDVGMEVEVVRAGVEMVVVEVRVMGVVAGKGWEVAEVEAEVRVREVGVGRAGKP
jgi:hypothetical protein